jgi:hypothetical protein
MQRCTWLTGLRRPKSERKRKANFYKKGLKILENIQLKNKNHMKTINELTEQEIIKLTNDGIGMMIKLKKAEEGIKFIECPAVPAYHKIPDPEMTVYSCEFFGDKLAFDTLDELITLIELLKKCTKFKIDYEYAKTDSDKKFANPTLDKPYRGEWFTPIMTSVYSKEIYDSICELLAENKKWKDAYEIEYKEYSKTINEAKWIEDEIYSKVSEVREKYRELESYCYGFRTDYLPLAEGKEDIAMKFLRKAYALTDEQEAYILSNYRED